MLELKGKLELKGLPLPATGATGVVHAANSELAELFVSLGYSSAKAASAIAALPGDAPTELEERLALRYFGG